MSTSNPDNVRDNALELYCKWLNMWLDDDPLTSNVPHYRPEQFTTDDPDNNLHGQCELKGMIPCYTTGGYCYLFFMTDGDEGGPTELIVYTDDTNTITHIIQGFDTSLQFIYSNEWINGPTGFVNTPTTKEA